MNIQTLLEILGRSSLQAGVLVLLVLAMQWLLRHHLAPRWRAALWWVVIARLLLPFTPDSAVSVFNLLPRWGGQSPPATISQPPPSEPQLAVPRSVPAPPQQRFLPVESGARFEPPGSETAVAGPVGVAPRPGEAATVTPPVASPSRAVWNGPVLLFWTWAAGVLALGGYVVIAAVRFRWRGRRWRPVTEPAALAVMDECARRMGVRHPPELVEGEELASPALFGVFRPRLLLPPGFLRDFSRQELRFVLLHELAHVRRRDLAFNWLVTGLQVLHWFNPLLWLGFARWRADRELACDALALQAAGGDQSREYGRTILRLLEGFTHRAPAPGLVGILEDKRQLKRRIAMIADFQPGRRWGIVSIVALVVLAVIGLTDAPPRKPAGGGSASAPGTAATNEPTGAEAARVGEDPLPEPPMAGMEVRSLTVTVLDPDGQPLPGAEIHSPYNVEWRRPPPKRLTAPDGRFILRFAIPPKERRRPITNFGISARHPDFAARAVMWTAAGGDVYEGLPAGVSITLVRGRTIGGVVQDERGSPLEGVRVLLSGSGYRGFMMGNDERRTHEYSELSFRDPEAPAAVTDAGGRWSFGRFAPDLKDVEVTFVRPDGAREVFATTGEAGLNQRPRIALAELERGTATVRLPDGVTVRGRVTDENGRPLAGVRVKEGYGHGNVVRIGEFVTDTAGRFERPHRAPRQWIYTAEHPERATVSVVAQVRPGMDEVRLVLPPPRPWRIEVVDAAGNPLPGAEVSVDPYRTEAQLLDWTGTTDEQGVVVWTNAPTEAVTFYARSGSPEAMRQFRIAPDQREKRVVLGSGRPETVTVRLKAVDATTREPVKLAGVGVKYAGEFGFRTLARPDASEYVAELKLSDLKVDVAPQYQFQLEAEGFETLTTDVYDFEMGDQELELALTKLASAAPLQVRLPDGRPATGARLWARTTPDGGTLFICSPTRYYGDRLTRVEADAEGRIRLPGAPGDAPVCLTHSNGFFAGSMADLRGRSVLTLQPYGTVEGRLRVGGRPKSGARISLSTLTWSSSLAFHLDLAATTDAEGRFSFTQVPPGEFKLHRAVVPQRRNASGLPITETHQLPVEVLPGRTNFVEYASAGRVIIGQAVAEPPDLVVPWQRDVHTLNLKLPVAPPRVPNYEDFATTAAFQRAYNEFRLSQQQLELAGQARTYALEIEPDGSFRVEDVPPGTYELRLRVTKPIEDGRPEMFGLEEELGSLEREVVVPEGTGPLDLGTVTVPLRGGLPALPAPAVALQATQFDGRPLDLTQFKGTNVVLVFWASWSDRSREQLAGLRELRQQFADESRLAIVTVSLDDTAEMARRTLAEVNCPGTPGWIEPAARAKAAGAFDVDTLPAVYLLDTQGRIIGRELEGERLPAMVRRTLAKN
ncbi:MAG: redoxin domain-containing protein [Verrucomicrobia bacterium]|nr:redoxin domain-containing protein [Verrucomicrobiota bacterium]